MKRKIGEKTEKRGGREKFFLFFVGGLIGFLNGFFGGGGGTVAVPVLEKMLKLDNKKAHATCIAIIFPLSIVSAGVYVFNGVIETRVFLFVAIGVLIGGVCGALLLRILPQKAVRMIFALLLLAGAVRLILW